MTQERERTTDKDKETDKETQRTTENANKDEEKCRNTVDVRKTIRQQWRKNEKERLVKTKNLDN